MNKLASARATVRKAHDNRYWVLFTAISTVCGPVCVSCSIPIRRDYGADSQANVILIIISLTELTDNRMPC
jgi:hypothetical protein